MRTVSLDYRETVDLLQWKLITFIRLNYALTSNIHYKGRFVNTTENAVIFNFIEFTEAYRAKYIDPDIEGYQLKFIEFIKPVFYDFIKEIRYGGHGFLIKIRYKAETFEKRFTVLNDETQSR
ncbi:hypothetical protein [Pedobacter gandavensis]|uniref:hypothetical protein n=1 Tax=Pedobacter gandavensis TaxID=2679963 RepID=UPI00292D8DAA|nr:hypothetical protein [Pedobacter gandavensis]